MYPQFNSNNTSNKSETVHQSNPIISSLSYDITNKKIPKIIHQIWIGPNKCPDVWLDTWRNDYVKKYPDWEYILWIDEDIDKLNMINRDLYNMETSYAGKADIARYEILYQYGGVYIDADSIHINDKKLDNLIENTNENGIFCAKEKENDYLANSVIGATPYNSLIYLVIARLREVYMDRRIKQKYRPFEVTGPLLITEVLSDKNITLYPSYYFYPLQWDRNYMGMSKQNIELMFPDSYMFQYGYTTNNLQGMFNDNSVYVDKFIDNLFSFN
jgi:mannosyltransferase OCH1-like enzyme